jgi:hypothetical protein
MIIYKNKPNFISINHIWIHFFHSVVCKRLMIGGFFEPRHFLAPLPIACVYLTPLIRNHYVAISIKDCLVFTQILPGKPNIPRPTAKNGDKLSEKDFRGGDPATPVSMQILSWVGIRFYWPDRPKPYALWAFIGNFTLNLRRLWDEATSTGKQHCKRDVFIKQAVYSG